MGNILSQFYFIPSPPLTEKNCPDQTGRVFIVTGGYAGVGLELCKILYARNATVHIAGRSAAKAEAAITDILAANPFSTGKLAFLQLDLSDLATIKPAVERFTAANTRLDVLVNNAGVMFPPAGSVDAQGHDLQVGTNCLGPYLLYQLLLPLLTRTAASSPTATVRVAWAASIAAQLALPSSSGMVLDGEGQPMEQGIEVMYAQTKVGNVFFAREFAKDTEANGVVHVAFNPGNLATELSRHWSGIVPWLVNIFITYPAVFGGYTELWAALSPEITPARSGAYVYPWGRFGSLPNGVEKGMQPASEGGTGVAASFLEWCEKQTRAFA